MFPIFADVIRSHYTYAHINYIQRQIPRIYDYYSTNEFLLYMCHIKLSHRIFEYRISHLFPNIFFQLFMHFFFHVPFKTNNIITIIEILPGTDSRFSFGSTFQNLFFLKKLLLYIPEKAIFSFFHIIFHFFPPLFLHCIHFLCPHFLLLLLCLVANEALSLKTSFHL